MKTPRNFRTWCFVLQTVAVFAILYILTHG
jgi:hypothetical protein